MIERKSDRIDYWNKQYYGYWKKRVAEANKKLSGDSKIIKGDGIVSTNDNYFSAIDLLGINNKSSVLEMGCGFGRSIPYLYKLTKNISAIDISESMLSAAKKDCKDFTGVKFILSEAEKTPFDSECFDYVICYGTFDSTYQNDTIKEINRIMKKNGRVLLTGKNYQYFHDDTKAIIAEKNARKKGEPNYFTNVQLMTKYLNRFGFSIVHKRYFLRRGDFVKDNFVTEIPNKFYEFLLVLQKCNIIKKEINIQISHEFSKTLKEINSKK